MERKRYQRKPGQLVAAVRLALDTPGFDYTKWGGQQHCKSGDFIVDNGGETYTVDATVFASTYQQVGIGQYEKVGQVWAAQAETAGTVSTKEGATQYQAGDYVVSNDRDGNDSWAVGRERFEAMYLPA